MVFFNTCDFMNASGVVSIYLIDHNNWVSPVITELRRFSVAFNQ